MKLEMVYIVGNKHCMHAWLCVVEQLDRTHSTNIPVVCGSVMMHKY